MNKKATAKASVIALTCLVVFLLSQAGEQAAPPASLAPGSSGLALSLGAVRLVIQVAVADPRIDSDTPSNRPVQS